MRVTGLNVYPIKSCGQLPVARAAVEPLGLAGDRRYMLVDEAGRFLTQRRHPRMALIRVEASAQGFTVRAADMPPLQLTLSGVTDVQRPVQVWQDQVSANFADRVVNAWFSRFLGSPTQLVFMADPQQRPLKPGRGRANDRVSFADGAPLLLISEASLADLNGRLARPVTMQRFRPNLVVSADTPFAEDQWRLIRVGAVEFEVAWACSRCVLTTVDPLTGEKDPDGEPLATLGRFRRVPEGIAFGQNLIPRSLGTIQVGDRVQILQTG